MPLSPSVRSTHSSRQGHTSDDRMSGEEEFVLAAFAFEPGRVSGSSAPCRRESKPWRRAYATAAAADGNVNSTCANVSSLPVHPMSGSIKGQERGSKRSFQSRVRAFPEVMAERAGL